MLITHVKHLNIPQWEFSGFDGRYVHWQTSAMDNQGLDVDAIIVRAQSRIKDLRLSQKEVLKSAGLSEGVFKNWKKGHAPNLATIWAIAGQLDMSPQELLFGRRRPHQAEKPEDMELDHLYVEARDQNRVRIHLRKTVSLSQFMALVNSLGLGGDIK